MEQDEKYFNLIENYLSEKGIDDPEIRMELSDHFCELLDHDQIDNEIIPADILSRVDDHFEASRFDSVYKKLVAMKRNLGRNWIDNILSRYSIRSAFLVLVIHRIIFFVLMPYIPEYIYPTIEPFSMALTAVFYFGTAGFFVLKAYKMIRA